MFLLPHSAGDLHGGVTSINRFIFATSDGAIEEELAASGCGGVIAGHCGLPFTRESVAASGTTWGYRHAG